MKYVDEDDKTGEPFSPRAGEGGVEQWLKSAVRGWMGKLSDAYRLSELSIPGTHDSGARFGGLAAECQDFTIKQQLEAGIRFFDIRCRIWHDDTHPFRFFIHHGIFYQNLSFDDVLTTFRDFLNANPTECLIINVQEEYEEHVARQHNTAEPDQKAELDGERAFLYIWKYYMNERGFLPYFYQGGDMNPTLGKMRKKIFVVRGHGAIIPSVVTSLDPSDVQMQNYYAVNWVPYDSGPSDPDNNASNVTLPAKVRLAKEFLQKTIRGDPLKWRLNYLSGSTGAAPDTVANSTNPAIYEEIGSYNHANGKKRVGVILMDFPGEKLIYRIIRTNFTFNSNTSIYTLMASSRLTGSRRFQDRINTIIAATNHMMN